MAPCQHIITHLDMDMTPCQHNYHSHGSGYGSMDLDIITYMDLHMAPFPHITA